jgi:hypothetical protein
VTAEHNAAQAFADFMNQQLYGRARDPQPIPERENESDQVSDKSPAEEFGEFLDNQLATKTNRVILRDPAYAQTDDPNDPVHHEVEIDKSSPEAAVKSARQKYGLSADFEKFLADVPVDKIEEFAARLAEKLPPDRPRTPRPDPAQGRTPQFQGGARSFEDGLSDAIRGAVMRADGQGAWREI